VGKVYYISNCYVKDVNKDVSNLKNDYELTFKVRTLNMNVYLVVQLSLDSFTSQPVGSLCEKSSFNDLREQL